MATPKPRCAHVATGFGRTTRRMTKEPTKPSPFPQRARTDFDRASIGLVRLLRYSACVNAFVVIKRPQDFRQMACGAVVSVGARVWI
jgi:hypothetical protein